MLNVKRNAVTLITIIIDKGVGQWARVCMRMIRRDAGHTVLDKTIGQDNRTSSTGSKP